MQAALLICFQSFCFLPSQIVDYFHRVRNFGTFYYNAEFFAVGGNHYFVIININFRREIIFVRRDQSSLAHLFFIMRCTLLTNFCFWNNCFDCNASAGAAVIILRKIIWKSAMHVIHCRVGADCFVGRESVFIYFNKPGYSLVKSDFRPAANIMQGF